MHISCMALQFETAASMLQLSKSAGTGCLMDRRSFHPVSRQADGFKKHACLIAAWVLEGLIFMKASHALEILTQFTALMLALLFLLPSLTLTLLLQALQRRIAPQLPCYLAALRPLPPPFRYFFCSYFKNKETNAYSLAKPIIIHWSTLDSRASQHAGTDLH